MNIGGRGGILSILVLPLAALSVALVGRASFWFAGQGFLSQLPAYSLVLVAAEVAQFSIARWLAPSVATGTRVSNPGLLFWGLYQLAAGVALIQLFSDANLWLGSTVLVYAGFMAIVVWAFLMARNSANRD